MNESQEQVPISVHIDTSNDIINKSKHSEIYVKLHVSARTSGLIRELGPERWQTLCTLATFMDSDGRCFPSAAQIAEAIGVTEDTAQRRLKALCDFRWNGHPIVTRVRMRRSGQQYANYSYTVLPVSQFSIFDGEVEETSDPPDAHVGWPPYVEQRKPPDVDVGITKTIYNKNHNKQKPYSKYNSKDILRYWAKKYKEIYHCEYVINYKKEGALIKNKLLSTFGGEKLVKIIDYTLAFYADRWATPRYPRPTIGQLASWLANRVAPLIDDEAGGTQEASEVQAPAPTFDYDEMKRRGLL